MSSLEPDAVSVCYSKKPDHFSSRAKAWTRRGVSPDDPGGRRLRAGTSALTKLRDASSRYAFNRPSISVSASSSIVRVLWQIHPERFANWWARSCFHGNQTCRMQHVCETIDGAAEQWQQRSQKSFVDSQRLRNSRPRGIYSFLSEMGVIPTDRSLQTHNRHHRCTTGRTPVSCEVTTFHFPVARIIALSLVYIYYFPCLEAQAAMLRYRCGSRQPPVFGVGHLSGRLTYSATCLPHPSRADSSTLSCQMRRLWRSRPGREAESGSILLRQTMIRCTTGSAFSNFLCSTSFHVRADALRQLSPTAGLRISRSTASARRLKCLHVVLSISLLASHIYASPGYSPGMNAVHQSIGLAI